MWRRLLCAVTAVLLLAGGAGPVFASAVPAVTLATDTPAVEVGARFAGTTVRLAGKCPPGSDVFVLVQGPAGKTSLSKRGQKGGVWLTVETVTVNNAPRFYWLLGSTDPSSLPPAVRQATGLLPDYGAVHEQVEVTARDGERVMPVTGDEAAAYVAGLVRINERQGLYGVAPRAIKVTGDSFIGTLRLPPAVPRGELRLTAYAVRGGELVGTAATNLPVRGVGLVKWLGEMSRHHAVHYGILAIAVALAAGLVVAELFRRINTHLGGKGELTGGH
ncbi:MAG: TIGR02186 family protein [Bacillota bacterium]